MERRKALAVAASTALLASSGVIATFAAWTGGDDSTATAGTAPVTVPLGARSNAPDTTPLDPVIVTERRDIYDQVVVAGTPQAAGGSAAPSAQAAPTATAPAPAAAAVKPSAKPTASAATGTASATTTSPSPTTTTRPPGVPKDWPADRPIPPMPAGCRQPQLEDNGTWNCQQ